MYNFNYATPSRRGRVLIQFLMITTMASCPAWARAQSSSTLLVGDGGAGGQGALGPLIQGIYKGGGGGGGGGIGGGGGGSYSGGRTGGGGGGIGLGGQYAGSSAGALGATPPGNGGGAGGGFNGGGYGGAYSNTDSSGAGGAGTGGYGAPDQPGGGTNGLGMSGKGLAGGGGGGGKYGNGGGGAIGGGGGGGDGGDSNGVVGAIGGSSGSALGNTEAGGSGGGAIVVSQNPSNYVSGSTTIGGTGGAGAQSTTGSQASTTNGVTVDTYAINAGTSTAPVSYGLVSIGGGGGGGGAGGTNNTPYTSSSFYTVDTMNATDGGNGTSGLLTVTGSLAAQTLLAGGSGGGGGASSSNPSNISGGNGGIGTIIVGQGGSLEADSILLGGSGGGAAIGNANAQASPGVYEPTGGGGGGNGGDGGNGTLIVEQGGVLNVVSSATLGGSGGNTGVGSGPNASNANALGGNGTLAIENGGTLSLSNGAVVQTIDTLQPASNSDYTYSAPNNGQGNVSLSGQADIEVNGSNTATISAPILDGNSPGTLVKTGTGTLSLSGANHYTGGTTIDQGILTTTQYSTASNGNLTVAITPNATAGSGYGQLQVAGTANLSGGTLTVDAQAPASGSNYEVGTSYDIISANQITGSFAKSVMGGAYGQYLSTSSQTIVNGSQQDYQITLTPSHSTYQSGHFYAASGYVQNSALFAALSAPDATDKGYWIHGLGDFGHARGVTYNYKGFVAGHGWEIEPNLIIGGAISNIYTNTEGANSSNDKGTSFGAEAYGIYHFSKWTFTGISGFGHLGNSATRYLPGIGQGKFATNGTYEDVSFQAHYAWLNRGHFFAMPYAQASYLHTYQGRGQETGMSGPIDMGFRYGIVHNNLAQLGGGLTLGYKDLTSHGVLTSWVSIGGTGTLGNTHSSVLETLGNSSSTVSAQVASVGAFTPSAGVKLAGIHSPFSLEAKWSGQFARSASGQAFTLQGSYRW